ncbi:MAG: hypothetical protein GF399_12685 [Candidatus Coatesbacteria bacterium]|nr:hypothetical protein [Candidatus Coatesbacteria bacterium]
MRSLSMIFVLSALGAPVAAQSLDIEVSEAERRHQRALQRALPTLFDS